MDLCECNSACALCYDTVQRGIGAVAVAMWSAWLVESERPWAWKLGEQGCRREPIERGKRGSRAALWGNREGER